MNTIWQFAIAGAIRFGRGSRHQLVSQMQRLNLSRPLVVTDSVISQLDSVQEIVASLRKSCTAVILFDEGKPEPAIDVAQQAVAWARDGKVDCVVGVGGGSSLDVAKVAATVLQHRGAPADYFGFDNIPGPVLPIIALPTTAGTGSEVSHSAVLTDLEQGVKVSTLSHWLRPTCAIVDPALTDSCPARVTAESGIDALVHAVEAYTNRDYTEMQNIDPQARAYEGSYPLTRMLAAEAIRLIGKSLVAACRVPGDESARDDMAWAATLAGMAFSNSGVGIVHALEYPIGALTHCGHGEGNGLLLPHVMRYNLPVRMVEFTDIARWLGVDVNGLSLRQSASKAVDAVVELQNEIGIRTRLSQLGLPEASIPGVAEKAFAIKRLMDVNPQRPHVADLESILRQAF